MNGGYLEMQVNGRVIGPIIAFREYIFRDVLPAFGNIDARSEQVANDYYNRIGSQPAGYDDDVDMADIADAAHSHSLNWFEMMTSLRQTMLNLLAAGLFHLTEQQLASLCRDGGFTMDPPRDAKLDEVAKWYTQHLRIELETLPSWSNINELRLVANAVKHAEGPATRATRQLRKLRPELFSNPAYAEIYKEYEEHGIEPTMAPVSVPLSGEEFFVSEDLLRFYAESAESFFKEIARYFNSHGDDAF